MTCVMKITPPMIYFLTIYGSTVLFVGPRRLFKFINPKHSG
jgi:hypothetical protein